MTFLIIFFRLLTDEKINSMKELKNAIKKLHETGPQIVCISSTEIDSKLTSVVSSAKGTHYFVNF